MIDFHHTWTHFSQKKKKSKENPTFDILTPDSILFKDSAILSTAQRQLIPHKQMNNLNAYV